MKISRLPLVWVAVAFATAVSAQAGPGLDYWQRQRQMRSSPKTSSQAEQPTEAGSAATASKEAPRKPGPASHQSAHGTKNTTQQKPS